MVVEVEMRLEYVFYRYDVRFFLLTVIRRTVLKLFIISLKRTTDILWLEIKFQWDLACWFLDY